MTNPAELTLEDLQNLAKKQQTIIISMRSFLTNTLDSMETALSVLNEVTVQVESLKSVHQKLDADVGFFLHENELDFRKTEGGTG